MGPTEDLKIFGDEVFVALCSYVYRLRMAVALMDQHNRQLGVSRETLYVSNLLHELLEASEDAKKAIWPTDGEPEEARLGQDEL